MEQGYVYEDCGNWNTTKWLIGLEMIDAILFGQVDIGEVEDVSLKLV